MLIELSIEVLIIIISLFGLLVGGFVVLQLYNTRTIRRLSSSVYERIRAEAEQEAQAIITNAHAEASTILSQAKDNREQLLHIYEAQSTEAREIVAEARTQAATILAGADEDRQQLASVYHTQIEQAKQIVMEAEAQARAIVASAKEQRTQVVDDYSTQIGKLQKVYEQRLAEHIGSLTEHIDTLRASQTKELTDASAQLFESIILEHGKIRKRFDKVLNLFEETQGTMVGEAKQAVDSVKTRLDETAQTLTEQLHTYDNTIRDTISEHIKHTYEVIDGQMAEYREAREAILDRHIQQIVEDVTRKVLNKQLTIVEHAELARDALAQAKKDNVI